MTKEEKEKFIAEYKMVKDIHTEKLSKAKSDVLYHTEREQFYEIKIAELENIKTQ